MAIVFVHMCGGEAPTLPEKESLLFVDIGAGHELDSG
jgi:hypothetical protein